MTDREALLRAIDASPGDDAPKGIYADWLEEHEQTIESPCPQCSQYANDPENPWKEIGYCPERDPASGRHEGGWSNCKTCNCGGPNYNPGKVTKSNGFSEEALRIREWLAKSPLQRAFPTAPAFKDREAGREWLAIFEDLYADNKFMKPFSIDEMDHLRELIERLPPRNSPA